MAENFFFNKFELLLSGRFKWKTNGEYFVYTKILHKQIQWHFIKFYISSMQLGFHSVACKDAKDWSQPANVNSITADANCHPASPWLKLSLICNKLAIQNRGLKYSAIALMRLPTRQNIQVQQFLLVIGLQSRCPKIAYHASQNDHMSQFFPNFET